MKLFISLLLGMLSLTLVSQQALAFYIGEKNISPHVARDLDPHPNVVRVKIVASEKMISFGRSHKISVWTYNGGIPGPTIKAKVGDKLIVDFYNELTEETTLHWHGLELPANQDGSHIAQLAVQPGAHRRYEFTLNRASLFWYHPHIRSDEQIEKGLYGALLVEDYKENIRLGLPKNGKQHVLVLDDVLLNNKGQFADHFSQISDPLARAKHILDGREGNLKLVNGRYRPRLKVRRGKPQRLRIVNTANSTFMRLSISGRSGNTMYRIGGDGGLLGMPIKIKPIRCEQSKNGNPLRKSDRRKCISDQDINKGILLTPGERADIVFTPIGRRPIKLEWHDIRRGRHNAIYNPDGSIALQPQPDDGQLPKETLVTFIPSWRGKNIAYKPPAILKSLEKLVPDVTEPLVLKFGHTLPNMEGNITFFAQDFGRPFPVVTAEEAYNLEVGKTYIWEARNLTAGIHNFHPHGFSMQLLETEYRDTDTPENNYTVPASHLEWKDTVALPARLGGRLRSSTIRRFAMKIDDTGREGQVAASGKIPTSTHSGGWLLHCHINEHSRNGMGTFFEVFEPIAE